MGELELEVSAAPGFYQRYHDNEEFDYEREPYRDASVLRRALWLDDYQLQAVRHPMMWTAAKMWANSLDVAAGGKVIENQGKTQQTNELAELAEWVRYWAEKRFGIRQKRDDNQKIRQPVDEIPHMDDQKLYEYAFAEFHPTEEAVVELVNRYDVETVADKLGTHTSHVEQLIKDDEE